MRSAGWFLIGLALGGMLQKEIDWTRFLKHQQELAVKIDTARDSCDTTLIKLMQDTLHRKDSHERMDP